ncbi:MAG: hypothetical protein FD131_3715 [Rhodocyclaceae bacterium]|nr:MAG: hypothetical protein FD131_3715 [Rhodocyclaceae bacterium]
MPLLRRSTFSALVALLVSVLLTACSPRQLVVGSIADELAAQGQASENDLDLAREASAFYLKLSESVLRSDPGHHGLAESVAGGFTQYAYAFVAFEADRIEAKDAKAAERLRRRAAQLYRRAHQHAMTALEKESPGFARALNAPLATDWPKLAPAQVGLAYWAAASWGGWISLSKDDPDVVADLPQAVRLTQLAWQADPAWGLGALTGLLATFEASRPGGSQAQALVWYDQAIAQGGGNSAGALVGKAEGYAQPAGDRALFESLLKQAVAIKDAPDSPQALQNEVMRRRAAWLLEQAPDLF